VYLQKGPSRKLSFLLGLIVSSSVVFASNGCTMCPSPFDYSGTVPGSANQNDFRIRANGILPIWSRPKPWPPVVSKESEEPRLASGESVNDNPAVSRIIVATADEEISTVQRDTSVLVNHSLEVVPADEDKQSVKNNSDPSETATERKTAAERVDTRSPTDS